MVATGETQLFGGLCISLQIKAATGTQRAQAMMVMGAKDWSCIRKVQVREYLDESEFFRPSEDSKLLAKQSQKYLLLSMGITGGQ